VKAMRRRLVCTLLLSISALAVGYGETGFRVSAGNLFNEGQPFPFAIASFDFGARNRFGATGFVAIDAGGGVSASAEEDANSASGYARLRVGRLFGLNSLAVLLSARGATGDAESAAQAVSGLSLPLSLNGESVSLSLEPGLEIDPSEAGYYQAFGSMTASVSAGDTVLRPGLYASARGNRDGTTAIAFKPSGGISWYPGIPATAGLSVEFIRSTAEDSAVLTAWGSVSPTELLLVSGESAILFQNGRIETDENVTIEILVPGDGLLRVSLPVEVRFQTGPALRVSVSAGCSFRF